jgi:hypothetical protein
MTNVFQKRIFVILVIFANKTKIFKPFDESYKLFFANICPCSFDSHSVLNIEKGPQCAVQYTLALY